MGTALLLALIAATDPVRLGIALLLISRPRPMRNLFAYWLGAIATGSAAAVGLLILLRKLAPMFVQNLTSIAASSTGRHIQIGIGLFALTFAVLTAVGFSARQRAPVGSPTGGNPLARPLQPSTPTAISRLLDRARGVLDGQSLWVAFAAGVGNGPPAVECVVAVAAILASGAGIGTQVGAAIAFIVVMLVVVEIPLVSYLATPAQTQAVMLHLHNWVRPRRRRILAVIVAMAGVLLVATGMGSS